MLTGRGWWLLLALAAMLGAGIWLPAPAISLVALALLAWFAWEWLVFSLRIHRVVPGLRLQRIVRDDRGTVTTLWAGRKFRVNLTLSSVAWPGLGYVHAEDAVPFGLRRLDGASTAETALAAKGTLEIDYQIECVNPGLARFEGVRLRLADIQGWFYHAPFLRAPLVLRVLPTLTDRKTALASTKRINEMPPPGVHRHRRPGSGSELLDLREYMPGDPPKTIAWKVSARRDRLMTKEFESEVPIRCTLFLDTSNSVRLPGLMPPSGTDETWRVARPLDRLVEISASVVQMNARLRDQTLLCLFDEQNSVLIRPDRSGAPLTRMLHRLADVAALQPTLARVDPELLLPLAYPFLEEVYPELLNPALNAMPAWVTWFVAFPARPRRRVSFWGVLYRLKLQLYVTGTLLLPLFFFGLYALSLVLVYYRRVPSRVIGIGLILATVLAGLSGFAANVYLILTTLLGEKSRRRSARRKRLAAVLAARYRVPGGLAMLLEDDDAFSLVIQRFLAEHRVPYALPLHDRAGRFQFASANKIPVLATALLHAVSRGHDNELFVLLVDLLELDDQLAPLMRAIGVARARHHQVLVVFPWPAGIAAPESETEGNTPAWVVPTDPAAPPLPPRLTALTTEGWQKAYQRCRRELARLGVSVVCAVPEQTVGLILDRIERLRAPRRAR